ncbi:MAG: AmmeMemoRadiSam system protein B [Acidobacteriota bacterium]
MSLFVAQCIALLSAAPVLRARLLGTKKVRQPAVAGSFYPASAKALAQKIDSLLEKVEQPPVSGAIVAAVAPHAGYTYSGPVAACTYAALRGKRYTRVVVIAPSHYAAFNYTSIYDGDGYATPLGAIPVDTAFAQRLAKMNPGIRLSEEGHASAREGGEHAIEVQLPWLQRVLDGGFTLVPVVMGDQSYESSRALGLALARLIQHENNHNRTLVLASSDLSHYHTSTEAESLDHKALHALEGWDYFTMARNFGAQVWEACGGGPVVAAMVYAERMGANRAEVLRYGHSGETSGDRTRVVGYSADVFVKAAHPTAAAEPFALSDAEKQELLAIARNSVEWIVTHRQPYDPPVPASATLNREYGAFVTLTKHGILRGCIGYTAAVKPLYMTLRDIATLAALRDPRFSPVAAEELESLSYEISVLSPLRHVSSLEEIEIGRDGLLVKCGLHEGLLLPQVAADQHWDRTRFVEETCHKAGLRSDAWKSPETDVFRFTAEVFSEK